MNKDSLIALRDDLQDKFDAQTTIETNAANEKLRLQGEYRLLNSLIDELETKANAKKASK